MTNDKEFHTLQAVAARDGLRIERVRGTNGRTHYIVIHRGRSIDCADLAAVRGAMQRLLGVTT